MKINEEMYWNKIKKYKFVSFDVFDTLIYRNVSKTKNIFDIVQIQAELKYNILAANFAAVRIQAEKKAILTKEGEEITLDEIYDQIECLSLKEKELLKELEIQAEKHFCQRNRIWDQILEKCRNHNIQIVIISDMYLPQNVIGEILKKSGVIYDRIFVSSKYKKRKSRGTLYKYVLSELNIDADEIIHIGDNKKSDYWIPQALGIKSIHYCRDLNSVLYYQKSDSIDGEILKAIIKNNDCDDYYENIGFQVFGPLLYGFLTWVRAKEEELKPELLLFLARDGFIIKKAYELLYGYSEQNKYLYVSRRSLTVPRSINAGNMKQILETIPYIKRNETMHDFLYKLGIEDDDIEKYLLKKYGEKITKAFLHSQQGEEVFADIKNRLHSNAEKELENCLGYLIPFFEDKKVALIDLGWYGTIQKSIDDLLSDNNIRTDIYGFYIGKIYRKDQKVNHKMQGYIYDCDRSDKSDPNMIFGFNGLIESFFTANHGSAKKYKKELKKYEVVLEDYEKENWEIISRMHSGALDFIKKAKSLYGFAGITLKPETAYSAAEKLFMNPSLFDIKELGKLVFYDVYYKKIVFYSGWKTYLRKPIKLYEDFMVSNWKIGYLKILTKILPPDKLYLLIIRLKGNYICQK